LTEVEGKADQIVSLITQRSVWPELLQDTTMRLGSNIWIVSFTPQSAALSSTIAAPRAPAHAPPVGRRGRGGEDEPPQPEPSPAGGNSTEGVTKTIGEIRIEGAGIHSADNPGRDIQSVEDFAENLRQSPFYDKTGVVIDVPPDPTSQGQTFTFTLRGKLQKPITP
jgi:hypothetical protein